MECQTNSIEYMIPCSIVFAKHSITQNNLLKLVTLFDTNNIKWSTIKKKIEFIKKKKVIQNRNTNYAQIYWSLSKYY